MEDYYLTLQLFDKRNVDWLSLEEENFIGDYNHRLLSENPNTLAILDEEERNRLVTDAEYLKCQTYIDDLRLWLSGSINRRM